jgi:hypothetical protein
VRKAATRRLATRQRALATLRQRAPLRASHTRPRKQACSGTKRTTRLCASRGRRRGWHAGRLDPPGRRAACGAPRRSAAQAAPR